MTRAEAERRVIAACLDAQANGVPLPAEVDAAVLALDALPDTGEADGWRQTLGFGEIVMMSEQRNRPGLPPRWCALARGRKQAAMGDSEEEARIAALALPNTGEG